MVVIEVMGFGFMVSVLVLGVKVYGSFRFLGVSGFRFQGLGC